MIVDLRDSYLSSAAIAAIALASWSFALLSSVLPLPFETAEGGRGLEEEEEETSFLIPLFLLSHSSPHHKQTKVKGGGGLYVHTYYIP